MDIDTTRDQIRLRPMRNLYSAEPRAERIGMTDGLVKVLFVADLRGIVHCQGGRECRKGPLCDHGSGLPQQFLLPSEALPIPLLVSFGWPRQELTSVKKWERVRSRRATRLRSDGTGQRQGRGRRKQTCFPSRCRLHRSSRYIKLFETSIFSIARTLEVDCEHAPRARPAEATGSASVYPPPR